MNILLSVDYGIYFFMICSSSYSIMVCLYRIVIVGIIYLYCITLHCIAFSYVATRDIPEGAEILLNYGSDWENAYHRHVQNWKSQSWNTVAAASPPKNAEQITQTTQRWKHTNGVYKFEHLRPCLILSLTPTSTISSNEESSSKHTRAPSSSRHHNHHHHYTVLMKN